MLLSLIIPKMNLSPQSPYQLQEKDELTLENLSHQMSSHGSKGRGKCINFTVSMSQGVILKRAVSVVYVKS